MSNLNSVDYPDDLEQYNSGTGVLYYNASLPIGTTGPFYVGNLASVSMFALINNPGTLELDFSDSPNPALPPPFWRTFYNAGGFTRVWDEVKVTAPYLFITASVAANTVLLTAGTGANGAPPSFDTNQLLDVTGQTISNSQHYSVTTENVVPGPAQAVAWAAGTAQPAIVVRDAPGGVPGACLGWAMGPAGGAAATGGSAAMVDFVHNNNPLQVLVYSVNGNTDNGLTVSVMSKRGFGTG